MEKITRYRTRNEIEAIVFTRDNILTILEWTKVAKASWVEDRKVFVLEFQSSDEGSNPVIANYGDVIALEGNCFHVWQMHVFNKFYLPLL